MSSQTPTESEVSGIFDFFNPRSPESANLSDTEKSNFLKTALLAFRCATPTQFDSTVKFVAKAKSKSGQADIKHLGQNPFIIL